MKGAQLSKHSIKRKSQKGVKGTHIRKVTIKRDAPINIRALPEQRLIIDRACKIAGKKRTDFVLDAACREAENILLDQRLFVLDDEAFAAFEAALAAPVQDNPALRELLTTKAPWE